MQQWKKVLGVVLMVVVALAPVLAGRRRATRG